MSFQIKNFLYKKINTFIYRKPKRIPEGESFITFTFDDFPISSVKNTTRYFRDYGNHATYYCSFNLMNKTCYGKKMFNINNIYSLLNNGNELGCHTFNHEDTLNISTNMLENSLMRNQKEIKKKFNVNLKNFCI